VGAVVVRWVTSAASPLAAASRSSGPSVAIHPSSDAVSDSKDISLVGEDEREGGDLGFSEAIGPPSDSEGASASAASAAASARSSSSWSCGRSVVSWSRNAGSSSSSSCSTISADRKHTLDQHS
jgi:hypothetical protein